MYPSECGRALKYVTCKGKNGCSIKPKKRCRKVAAATKAKPKYFTNHTTKGTKILCKRDYMYNRKGRLKSQGIFPNKSQPQPTDNTRKTTTPTQVPPSPTQHLNKHALIHIHTPTYL